VACVCIWVACLKWQNRHQTRQPMSRKSTSALVWSNNEICQYRHLCRHRPRPPTEAGLAGEATESPPIASRASGSTLGCPDPPRRVDKLVAVIEMTFNSLRLLFGVFSKRGHPKESKGTTSIRKGASTQSPKRTYCEPRTNSVHCLDPRNGEHIGGRPAHPL
jgi:hypothetical protein